MGDSFWFLAEGAAEGGEKRLIRGFQCGYQKRAHLPERGWHV